MSLRGLLFNEGIPVDIKPTVSQLQRLYFSKCTASLPNQDHLMLKDVLPWVPDLVQVGLTYLNSETSAALAAHCPRVQSFLQLSKKKTIRHERPQGAVAATSLGLMLAGCSNLTVFDSVHYEIQAQCLLENPWSCQGLEVLRLQIVGAIRLSGEEEMDYKQGVLFQRMNRTLSEAEVRAVEKYEQQVREQHRQIYGRLAKLVNLRVLELGMEYRDIAVRFRLPMIQRGAQWYRDYGDSFPDTLELSLASGLDQLSTLSKLEVFGFESVDHRIDEEELRWMAEKWPRLQIMRGLQETEELPLLMHDGEKWHRRVFMQRLRPDVKHEALFKIGK